MGDTALLNIP
ncbi:unnamed protein product, partial [Rotaria sp. Silwood1]